MVETLLTSSSIKLFGRVLKDLKFNYDAADITQIGANNFLQEQLAQAPVSVTLQGTIAAGALNTVTGVTINGVASLAGLVPGMLLTSAGILAAGTTILCLGPAINSFSMSANALAPNAAAGITAAIPGSATLFARIYAFSFEGAIYSLPKPSIFLVHGKGTAIGPNQGSGTNRTNVDLSGVVAREWEFSDWAGNNPDLVYWEYEKGDFSIRLDMEAGQFEQILLAAALRAGADMADRATGIRSGASLAGASLAGASLSGASLSGASLSGASLSGASLRNGR